MTKVWNDPVAPPPPRIVSADSLAYMALNRQKLKRADVLPWGKYAELPCQHASKWGKK